MGGGGLTAEFLILVGKHKGLWNDVEVLQSVSLLHSLDVFVEAVFARQFVRPGNEQNVRHKRADDVRQRDPSGNSADPNRTHCTGSDPTSVALLPGKVVDLLEVLKVA